MTDGKDAGDVLGRSPTGVRQGLVSFGAREKGKEVLDYVSLRGPFTLAVNARPINFMPHSTPHPRNPDQLSINPQSIDTSHYNQVSGLAPPNKYR